MDVSSLDYKIAAVRSNLASAQKILSRFDEAIAEHQRAIELEPGLAEAHYNLSTAYKDAGLIEAAALLVSPTRN